MPGPGRTAWGFVGGVPMDVHENCPRHNVFKFLGAGRIYALVVIEDEPLLIE